MDETKRGNFLTKVSGMLIVVVVIVAAAFFTKEQWWHPIKPGVARLLGFQVPEEETEEEQHEQDPDILTISEQARESLGIKIGRVKKYPVFERTIRVPGRIVEIPGVSLQDVTASLSGVITRVHVRKGQEVKPGDRLFEISLIHEAAVQLQLELLDALGKFEVTDLEIQRLTELNLEKTNMIARSRILQQKYEKRRLDHTIESRKQALMLLGFSEKQIAHLVQEHEEHPAPDLQSGRNSPDEFEHPLIDTISIRVPGRQSSDTRGHPGFLVSELPVHPGEHVEAGQLLCRLADYQTLYVEGRAFEHHITDIRRAMRQQWPVVTVLNPGDRKSTISDPLRILFQDPKVDPDSGTTHFYVELKNKRATSRRSDGRVFVDWESRPGQLVEVLVPVERLENKLVVPVEAVAQDGLDNYMFQASGPTFIRRPVTIVYRDQRHAVLGTGSRIYEGDAIATSGAYQLQLAIQNRSGGPVDPHAGHDH